MIPTMSSRVTRLRASVPAGLALAGAIALAAPGLQAQAADPAHAPAPAQSPDAGHAVSQDAHGATAPAAGHDAPAHGAADDHGGGGHGESHGESVWVTLARIANFGILAGLLYALGRKPLAAHLASRRDQIRKDLVEAAELKQTATARLAEIETKLAGLPAELESLRTRGAEELAAERARVRAAAEAERDRLIDQARKDIESQTRAARATLRAHAATLAVEVAEARLKETLTPAEQAALVDGYAAQMRNVQ